MKQQVSKNIIGMIVILAVSLLAVHGYALYKNISLLSDLNNQVRSQSTYVSEVNNLQQQIRNYYSAVESASADFYTDARIFSLWRHIGDYFGTHFVNLAISKNYITDNNLKWFVVTITASYPPVKFIQTVKKIKPKLYIMSLTYDKNNGFTTGTLKGAVLSDKNGFVITPSLYKTTTYKVCKFVMATKDPSLIPPGYISTTRMIDGDKYYIAGTVLVSNLDMLSAEATASHYAQSGIITFIVGGD